MKIKMKIKWRFPIIVITAIIVLLMVPNIHISTVISNDEVPIKRPPLSIAPPYSAALVVGGDETDLGFSYTAIQAMYALEANYNWTISISRLVNFADQYNVLSAYGAAGYDVVFAVGGQFIAHTYWSDVTTLYIDTLFVQIPGDVFSPYPNLVGLHPAFQTEGHYLAGVLAGLMTETNRVGAVFGEWYDYLAMEFYAFEAGVKSVNIDSLVYARVAGAWNDALLGKQITETLIETKNVDIVVQVADLTGRGVIAACIEADIAVIGTVADQWSLAPLNTMTSIGMNTTLLMDLVAKYVENSTAMSALGGTSWDIPIGNYLYPYHHYDAIIPQSVKDKVDEVEASIANGTIVVPRIATLNPPADPVAPDTLSITAPDSSSAWETNTFQWITWSSTGSIANVKIELYLGGTLDSVIVASTPNDGAFRWTVPLALANSSLYQINITHAFDPLIFDMSDNFEIFTLPSPVPWIDIHTPSGAVEWESGTSQVIVWSSTVGITNVKIELYLGGTLDSTIIASTPNDNIYTWAIPSGLDNTNYQIKITDASDPLIFDMSNNFEIIPPTSEIAPIPGFELTILGLASVSMIAIIVIYIRRRNK